MPKYRCVSRCYVAGIGVVEKDDTVEIGEAKFAGLNVKKSFVPASGASSCPSKEEPLKDDAGDSLPKEAQMTVAQLKARLDSLGVKFPVKASKQELFGLLQDALKVVGSEEGAGSEEGSGDGVPPVQV